MLTLIVLKELILSVIFNGFCSMFLKTLLTSTGSVISNVVKYRGVYGDPEGFRGLSGTRL